MVLGACSLSNCTADRRIQRNEMLPLTLVAMIPFGRPPLPFRHTTFISYFCSATRCIQLKNDILVLCLCKTAKLNLDDVGLGKERFLI